MKEEGLEVNCMEAKTMKDMQKEVDAYIGQFKEGYFQSTCNDGSFNGRNGELAREVNHYYGEKPKKTTEKNVVLKKSLRCIICYDLYGK